MQLVVELFINIGGLIIVKGLEGPERGLDIIIMDLGPKRERLNFGSYVILFAQC